MTLRYLCSRSGSLAMFAATRRAQSDSFHLDHAKSGVRVYVYDQDQAMRPPEE
jgi:hypothetical protein